MKFSNCLGILLILGAMVNCCLCLIYTSPYQLERLISIERKLVKKMLTYIQQQAFNKNKLNDEIIHFIDLAEGKNRQKAFSRALDTPLTSYHLLKRIVNQWEDVKRNMSCTGIVGCPLVTGEEVIDNVWSKEDEKPTEADLETAALGIINVWNVFNLSMSDVISGKFPVAEDDPLTADDVMYIANVAKNAGKTYEAVIWFEYLLANLKKFPEHEFKLSALYKRLASSYHEHGVTSKAVQVLKDYIKKEPSDSKTSRDLKYYETRAKKSKLSEVLRFQEDDSSKKTKQRKAYEHLCRNGAQGKYRASNLTCQLLPLLNSYGRSKVETLSLRPKIQRYHDVLNKAELTDYIDYANQTYGQVGSYFINTEYSVSSHQTMRSGIMCEANKPQFPLLHRLSARLERMTRFHLIKHRTLVSSLCYELANEGVGSYQKPVLDYRTALKMADPKTPYVASGNKVATVVLQLSDVAYGGGVVFPRADLHVPVVKGSAVVIWNLKENGQPEPRSLRVNCPVVVGSKWTAMKQVFYNNQIFRRPCEAQN